MNIDWSNADTLSLLCCGFLRTISQSNRISHKDIAIIVTKYSITKCGFDFGYDFWRRGSKWHGIENYGKTVKCYSNNNSPCDCFYTINKIAMKPMSGIYKIEIEINTIDIKPSGNMLGITCEKYNNHHNQIKMKNEKNNYTWWMESSNYIGWSACDRQDDNCLPNGLLCGGNDENIENNIFRKNNFIYKSNNDNYEERLPGWCKDDILSLEYNSDLNQLSFSKLNDNKLNSQISNLPKDKTFYWFVGHYDGDMLLTMLD